MLIVQAPLCTSKKYILKKENSKHQSKSCTTKKHFFIFLSLIIFRTYPHCIPLKIAPFIKDPGAAPDFVKAFAESSTAIRVVWKPPPVGKRNGDITYYKIFYVPSSVPSTREEEEATLVRIEDSDAAEWVIDELRKWTEYRVWMLAGTIVGDGPPSYPVLVRTGEDGRFYCFSSKENDRELNPDYTVPHHP